MKSSHHKIALKIDATAASAWNVIGAVSGVDKWLAPITSCRVEGNKRYCTTEAGEFSEDILNVDHDQMLFQYAIPEQNMIPIQNIQGAMKVLPTGTAQAMIEWSWSFEVEEANEAEAKEALTMVGNMGIKGIEDHIHALV